MRESIQRIIDHKLKEAKKTIYHLGLDLKTNSNKKILELGCGIGALSKELVKIGHHVISCDDYSYNPPDHSYFKDNQLTYVHANKFFNWPRHHFRYETPHNENRSANDQMFDILKNYGSNYDFIIIQGFDLWQISYITLECTIFFVESLKKLLNDEGKLMIGYVPFEGFVVDNNFESSKSYKWLRQWQTDLYHNCLGFYTWDIPKF